MIHRTERGTASTRKPNLANVRTANQAMLRLVNRRILLGIIAERQPISRAKLAKVSGLNKATVSSIVSFLLRAACVVEQGTGKTTPIGGKPPIHLTLNRNRYGLFGLDIAAEETTLALADFNGQVCERRNFPTGANPERFLPAMSDEIGLLRSAHPEFHEFIGIGVSLPGLVDHEGGVFLTSVVLPWRDVPVRARLERATGLSVMIDNSARCSALAEIWHGRHQDPRVRNLLFVGVGAGLSCGVVIDGTLYRGVNHTAGQFGHMTIDVNGPECSCGQRGCWDLYASEKATIARYVRLRGIASARAPTMRRLIELVEEGEPAAVQAVSETGRYLGLGLAGLANGLEPEMIVIGGEITRAWGVVEPIITEVTHRNLLNPRERAVPIRASTFEVRPTLKGALTLVLNELLSVPHLG